MIAADLRLPLPCTFLQRNAHRVHLCTSSSNFALWICFYALRCDSSPSRLMDLWRPHRVSMRRLKCHRMASCRLRNLSSLMMNAMKMISAKINAKKYSLLTVWELLQRLSRKFQCLLFKLDYCRRRESAIDLVIAFSGSSFSHTKTFIHIVSNRFPRRIQATPKAQAYNRYRINGNVVCFIRQIFLLFKHFPKVLIRLLWVISKQSDGSWHEHLVTQGKEVELINVSQGNRHWWEFTRGEFTSLDFRDRA